MFKTTKVKVIFVAVFSLICIIITTILILYKNIDIEDITNITEEPSKEIDRKDVLGIDINGTYNQNDLELNEVSVTKEKVEIRYFQIKGLKNKTIEDKINKEIEHIALNWYKEEIDDLDKVVNVNISMWKASNFANTISLEIDYAAKINDNGDGFYQGIKGLNYDLNTGEQIKIENIFTSDAPIEDILRKSSYYNFVSCTIEDNLVGDSVIADYGDIEDEILSIINLYKNGKIKEYIYTPQYINLYYEKNKCITIFMEDYYDYIAIYNRYLKEESLFQKDDIGIKNIYNLSNRYNDIFYYQNYQKEDNYFIDISIDFQSDFADEFAKKLVQEKINAIEKEIENVRQKVKENQNNFYILNYYINIYTGEEWSTKQILTSCYERGNYYEMTVHDFEENIEPIIVEYNRSENEGGIPDYIYDFSEKLKIEPQNTVEYYNPENEEKIVI